MNKTTIIIIIVAVVVLAIIIAIYLYSKRKKDGGEAENNGELSSRKDGKVYDSLGKVFTGNQDGLIYKDGLVTGSYKPSLPKI